MITSNSNIRVADLRTMKMTDMAALRRNRDALPPELRAELDALAAEEAEKARQADEARRSARAKYAAEQEERRRQLNEQYAVQRREGRIQDVIRAMGDKYAAATLDNFELYHQRQNDVFAKVKEIHDDIVEFVKSKRGILMYGCTGCGKDHLLAALLKRAAYFGRMEFKTGDEIISGGDQSRPGRNFDGEVGAVGVSDPIAPTGGLPDWQMAKLFTFFDETYRKHRPLWVTINALDIDQAKKRLTTPIFERIVENAVVLECKWPSYRTRKIEVI